jgi:hypothetical protein
MLEFIEPMPRDKFHLAHNEAEGCPGMPGVTQFLNPGVNLANFIGV